MRIFLATSKVTWDETVQNVKNLRLEIQSETVQNNSTGQDRQAVQYIISTTTVGANWNKTADIPGVLVQFMIVFMLAADQKFPCFITKKFHSHFR